MSDKDGLRADWAQKDFYAQLGVSRTATAEEIKKAYRRLARANHPDSNPGDTAKHEKFKAVAEAYDVVGDPEKRARYDEVRSLYASGGFGGGFGGGSGSRGPSGGFNLDDLLRDNAGGSGGLGDMFGDLFRGGGGGGGFGGSPGSRRPRPAKGTDLETTTTIGFSEALEGVTVSLRLASEAPCPTCSGTGGKPGTKPHICPECEGSGFVVNTVGGGFSMNETCPGCGGRQLVYDEACPTCHGSGRGRSDRSVQARVPAGVKDGQKIRLRGKGGAGENGGPAGDLYITVKVSPHRVFARKGDNLTLTVPVSFVEATLGADVKVPTLGGAPVTLKVPAGTPTGRTFRVRGRGATKKDGTRGDLLATVEVQVPSKLDADARAAVEALRDATTDTGLRAGLFESVDS